jgi:hypothetical protein
MLPFQPQASRFTGWPVFTSMEKNNMPTEVFHSNARVTLVRGDHYTLPNLRGLAQEPQ